MNPKMVSNDKGRMLVPKKHYLLAALCLSCTFFFLYRELNQFFVERPTKQVSSPLSSLRPTNAVS